MREQNMAEGCIMGALAAAAIGVVVFFQGVRHGRDLGTAAMQRRAVEVGAAEWAVKPDGETQFRWVTK